MTFRMNMLIIDNEPRDIEKIEILSKGSGAPLNISRFLNFETAKKAFRKKKYDLIILNPTLGKASANEEDVRHILENQGQANFLFLIEEEDFALSPFFKEIKLSSKKITHIYKPLSVLKLSSKLLESHDIFNSKTTSIEEIDSQMMPLEIDLFKKIPEAPCDVFFKISERKIVKIINEGSSFFNIEQINSYKERGIHFVYISRENFYAHIESISGFDLISREMTKSPTEFGIRATEAIIHVCNDLGINERVLESVNETLEKVSEDLQSTNLTSLLSFFSENKESFLYGHSYLTSVFSTLIIKEMDWNSEQARKNLSLAAIFHDLSLGESHEILREGEGLSNLKKITEVDRDFIINHPAAMAERLSSINSIPSDAINLIAKHHEGRGAESYPQGLSDIGLSPVNCLFNIAHQFSLELYKISFNLSKIDIALNRVKQLYPGKNFKGPINALEESIKLS